MIQVQNHHASCTGISTTCTEEQCQKICLWMVSNGEVISLDSSNGEMINLVGEFMQYHDEDSAK